LEVWRATEAFFFAATSPCERSCSLAGASQRIRLVAESATVDLLILRIIGRLIGSQLGIERWGLPEALLAAALGLIVAPNGPLPLLPPEV